MHRLVRVLAAAAAIASATAASAQSRAPAAREETDFDRNAGHLGLAFFGVRSFDFSTGTNVASQVDVYTVGVRRWGSSTGGFGKGWGLEGGVGLVFGSDKTERAAAGGTLTASASAFGLGLHLGMPLALAQGRHATVLVLPEANLILATGTNDLPVKTDWKGFGLDLGARAGIELQLGFIGAPQVSLDGSVGLGLHYQSTSWNPGAANLTGTSSNSRWRFGTDAPRGLIAGNLAIIYYL
jgi:hypothetical protein